MGHILILTLTLILLGASPEASAAAPGTDAQIHDAIENVLAQIHPMDTPDWWRGLGPSAPGVIISMYDQESFVYHRLRLVQALAWFDDPAATAFLEKQATETPDDVIRNGAIQSLGTSQGAGEEDFIAKFLSSDDPQTRLVAAQALRKGGGARSQAYLSHFLADEKVQWVKDKFTTGSLAPAPLRIERSAQPPTSRDVISHDFAGDWRGFALVPDFADAGGIRSYPSVLHIEFSGAEGDQSQVRGALTIRRVGANAGNSGATLDASFRGGTGGGARFRTEIPWAKVKMLASGRGGGVPVALMLEVELFPELKGADASRVHILRATFPGIAGVLVLRRD